jgi:nucleoside-diphosphate kinase
VPRTLVIVKPDGVQRHLIGEIIARLERRGLAIERAELRVIDRATAERHYAEHAGKTFYEGLVAFITAGPSMVMVVAGPDDAWRVVRTMMGATNPADAAPGTIRGDLAVSMPDNLIHGSDSAESAEREIALFFG